MALEIQVRDVERLISCKVHIGTKNQTQGMERYIHATKKDDGINIINLHATWQKIILAARIIVAIENPQDVMACSTRLLGQRAVLKFAHYTGAQYVAGRLTPGMFTNQSQKTFQQPRLLIVTDPRTDHQAIREARYVNIPIIALCDTDSPLGCIDVAIPCNNRGVQSIGFIWWMLTREVLRMRGSIPRSIPWTIVPDLFFYRDPDAVMRKKEEAAATAIAATAAAAAVAAPPQMDDSSKHNAANWVDQENTYTNWEQ